MSQPTTAPVRSRRHRWLAGLLMAGAASWLPGAQAQSATPTPTLYEEQGQLMRGSGKVTTLGPDLFGDEVSLYSGALSFRQTDINLPGNSALQVAVGRRLGTGASRLAAGAFGDWELEIPHIKGVYARTDGWNVGSNIAAADRFKRCSRFAPPADTITQTGMLLVTADEFWSGNTLYVPGAGEQRLLARRTGGLAPPSDGQNYPVVTQGGWVLRCITTLKRGQTGEGFVAVSPEGTQYQFDWLVSRVHPSYVPMGGNSLTAKPPANTASTGTTGTSGTGSVVPNVAIGYQVLRSEVFLLPTRVTDRFGNTVTYTYSATSPWQLTSITASDGRAITLGYTPGTDRVQSASDGTRTWTYTYAGSSSLSRLTTVTQPDASRWQFGGDDLQVNPSYTAAPADCRATGAFIEAPRTLTMTHPSGASGAFTLKQVLRGRSHTPNSCVPGYRESWLPIYYLTRSLTQKTLSGPGLAAQSWVYTWGAPNASLNTCMACPESTTVDVRDPRGHTTRYTHGIRWHANEGQLLSIAEGWNGSTAVRTTTQRYRSPTAGPYPDPIGDEISGRGDSLQATHYAPMDQRIVVQQGVNFSWQATAFSIFAKPTVVTQSSSLGTSRTRSTVYENNLARWVLGQVKSVTDTTAGTVIESHTYHPTSALRTESYRHGLRVASYAWNADGTLYVVYDPASRATYYTNYKLGIAQNISYPDGAGESALVNALGLISQHTNAAGTTTFYGYDTMGRLAQVTPPAEAGFAYNGTTQSFESVPYAEYGLPAGHWRQTISTGNARSINYFDALWRPVLSLTYDAANSAATSRMVQTRWDIDGRKTFESYPQRSITAYNSSVAGTAEVFDVLGRSSVRRQDSELGLLSTTTEYLSGFQRRVTNPRGKITSYGYQVFDTPSEDAIAWINAPESVSVSIARNLLGMPTAITRSGPGPSGTVSATRRYVYDSYLRLCKTIEPETGATLQDYDGANNVAWRASGLALNSLVCDRASVPAARMVAYGYDTRNRLTTTLFGDGSPGIGRAYTPDGLLRAVNTGVTAWTYGYNNRRLLTSESLVISPIGTAFPMQRGYDANGKLSWMTYPAGPTVHFNPNALGEPTTVTGYASGASYHPNGAIAGYTLANGVVHSTSQNTRGLPWVWRDAGVMQDVYTYDASGNVSSIADQQEGGATSRSMGYDGLDRLTAANGIWGAGGFNYDGLDNLRGSTVGGRSLAHNVDPASNRLTSLTGSQSLAIGYDANGNVTQRGAQAYTFDIGNRLVSATGKASYGYDGHGRRAWVAYANGTWKMQFYSQDGQLLFARHSTQGDSRNFYLGGRLVADATGFSHTDALGSPVAHTNRIAQIVDRTRYEPYGGTAAGTNPTGLGFTGHVNDADTGLVYMQQRYCDPVAGRFLSVDPVTTDAKTGSHFNRYQYGENSPYKFRDPDGRSSAPALEITLDAATGGGGLGVADVVGNAAVAQAVQTAMPFALAGTVAPSGAGSGQAVAAKGVANQVPSTMARVIPNGIPATTLGRPGASDVFATGASDIAGLSSKQIAQRLTIAESPTGFKVIEFATPRSGVASPVFRSDPGFVGGGRTAGGAREYVIPNGPIPADAIIRTVP